MQVGQNRDMVNDSWTPDFETVFEELREIRERGLASLRRVQPRALTAIAARAGLLTDDDAVPAAIEELLRQAAEIFEDGADRDVAEFSFGLAQGWRMRAASARRQRAAEAYGISADSFRKEPERAVVEQMAEGVMAVARAASRQGARPKPVANDRDVQADAVPALAKLESQSRQLAADLDLVTVGGSGQTRTIRLSDGLYIERDQQAKLLDGLRDQDLPRHFLVCGEAGHGKSSLLWSLYTNLRKMEGSSPLLLSAAWLLDEPGVPALMTVEEILSGVSVSSASGVRPVVLLDTADLLLHHEAQRLKVLELHHGLRELGVQLVLTVRPREADLLASTDLMRVELPPYSDTEADRAVEALTKTYSPDTPVREAVEMVRSAVARGLPIREVVRNPLTLRMWFENASPQLPSVEADVTSIYRSYWRTRVADDRRQFAQATAASDHSRAAGALGIAMLGLGSPELALDVAARHVAPSAGLRATSAERALDDLARRGVLVRQGDRIRFFHQTLFEFAAAEGLLARDPGATIRTLMTRMTAQPDDLFVAAVLEQYAILAAGDPSAMHAVTEGLSELLASDHPVLPDLALVVWAHHPQLDIATDLLTALPASALRRFLLVAPTVAGLDVNVLVDRLGVIWERPDRATRRGVLQLLARLAPRDPAAVARAMGEFDCVAYFLGEHGTGDTTVTGLPEILGQMASVAPRRVVDDSIAILTAAISSTKGRDMTVAVLRMLGRAWPVVGSAQLLEQVTALVVAGQENGDRDSKEVREALGEVMAAAWGADALLVGNGWSSLVESVAQDTEANDESPRAGGGVCALTCLLAQMPTGDERIPVALDRLWALKPSKAPWQPTRGAYAELLVSDSPAADYLAERLVAALDGLPARANHPEPGPELHAAVARQTLDNPRIPHAMVAALLGQRDYPPDFWLDHEGLLALSATAAVGGLAEAREAILHPLRPYADWPERAVRILHGRLHTLVPGAPDFFPAYLGLASRLSETAGLRSFAREGQCVDELTAHSDVLAAYAKRLLGGGLLNQRASVNLALDLERAGIPLWDADALLTQSERVTDAWARATLLELRGERALKDAASIPEVIAACASRVSIEYDPPALKEGRHSAPSVVMEAARTAWLRVLAATTLDPGDAPLITALALAPRMNQKTKGNRTPTELVMDTGLVGYLAEAAVRYADRGDTSVALRMVADTQQAANSAGPQHANLSNKAANRLRGAFRAIVRRGSADEIEALIRLAFDPRQPAWGKLIVTTLATEGITRFRDRLLALLRDPNLPPSVAGQIHTELKSRARVAGAGQFTDILEVPTRAR